jgi:cytochrome c peroxidase
MTEEQIERRVERMMDALDAQLMNSALTQSEYDNNVRDLNAWAEAKMNEGKRTGYARMTGSVECPHCHWGFAPSVIEQHVREKHDPTRLKPIVAR